MEKRPVSVLITFEGNEGCGKSTQIRLLARALKKQGRRVFQTREPGGTRAGDAIRRILLDRKQRGLTPAAETLLYMASRAQLVREVIRPKLKAGRVVLCDRWMDATVSYQGYAGGVPLDWIRRIGEVATGGLKPLLTIFLDLPLEEGLRRARQRSGTADRLEAKNLSFHRKVRRGFLEILKKEPKRFLRLRVSPLETPEEIHRKVLRQVGRVLSKHC